MQFTGESSIRLFENEVSVRSIDAAIDWFGISDLSERDQYLLGCLKINLADFDDNAEIEYAKLRKYFKLLQITVDKNYWGDFVISALVLDPLNRGWLVCPGDYLEHCDHEHDSEILVEYSELNDVPVESLFMKL
jgi:hypothetical protein